MAKKSPEKYLPKGIRILFEDQDLMIVDKDAGLLSVAAKYEKDENVHALLTLFYRKGSLVSKKELFPVNRLDRETSGILLFAKSFEFREKLHEHWEEVEKYYLAVVDGKLPQKTGLIESYLMENKDYRVKSTPNSQLGKLAKTAYEVIFQSAHWTTVKVHLLTGRKNQIRVHFSEMKHPVLGDTMYGKVGGSRLALHAWKIKFTHPRTKQVIELESEPPVFFNKFLPKQV